MPRRGFLVDLLGTLPAYTEILLTFRLAHDDVRTHRLMARDMPERGRRFTNLETGTEWFITETSLENINAQRVEIPGLNLECGR